VGRRQKIESIGGRGAHNQQQQQQQQLQKLHYPSVLSEILER